MAEPKGIPSKNEIQQLPKWAQVSFAARCARRVQPLFVAFWHDAPQEHVDAIERAISVTEKVAAKTAYIEEAFTDKATFIEEAVLAKAAAKAAAEAAARTAVEKAGVSRIRAARAGVAAAVAYTAVDAAATVIDTVNAACSAIDAIAAVSCATVANGAKRILSNIELESQIIMYIRRDFESLIDLVKEKNLKNKSTKTVEVFGLLWPDEEPNWPKMAQDVDLAEDKYEDKYEEYEPLRFLIDPGIATPKEISELYHEISKLYVMMGGSGIDFRTLRVREGAGVYV